MAFTSTMGYYKHAKMMPDLRGLLFKVYTGCRNIAGIERGCYHGYSSFTLDAEILPELRGLLFKRYTGFCMLLDFCR